MPPTYPTYVKESERHQLGEIRQKAVQQLKEYMESREMVGRRDLKAAALIFIGKTEIVVEEVL
jgi:hypothetical protein